MEITKRIFGNELRYLQEVLESEFRSSLGSVMVRRLEQAFAEKFNSHYAIAHVNGTATLHTLLEAIDLQPGDEVIVPPLTMSATSFAVLQANGTPVFADVDPETFQISPQSIEERVSTRTRAIITVALYGLSPDMDAIRAIAEKHHLVVIEDNAQAFLSTYKGRFAGTLGHAASFSFQSSKHISSGEGGMVITQDEKLAERVRKINSLGYAGVSATKGKISKRDIQDPTYARHVSLGWNYRMPELCAAVALAQFENIDAIVERRIRVSKIFDEIVRSVSWLVPQKVPEHCQHSYWTYAVSIHHPKVGWPEFRDRFLKLGGDGIYAAWMLTYLEPMFQKLSLLGREKFIADRILKTYRVGLCPVAERLQPRLLQFKTNYWHLPSAYQQAEILGKTLRSFE